MSIPRFSPRHPRSGSPTVVIGHRGDPSRFPQNSIEGILASADHASMAEIDVRPTRDGVLVLSHDPVHTDAAGVTTVLCEHEWEQLADLEIGDGHRLGRFAELIERAGDFALNIEIKNWPEDPDFDPRFEFPLAAAALARPHDLITCFHWPTMHAIAARHPQLMTGLLVAPTDSIAAAATEANEHGHGALAVHWTLAVDIDELLDAAGELDIFVWTVNDTQLGIRLADAGVAGLITDDPRVMVAALQGDTP